jgi:hypothetical protein
MRDRGAERHGVAEERHLLATAGKEIGFARFYQRAEGADVANPLHAGEDRLADGGEDLGVATLSALEPLSLLDDDLKELVLARIEDATAEEAGFAQTLLADRHDALGADDLGRAAGEELRGDHVAEIDRDELVAVARRCGHREPLRTANCAECPTARQDLAGGLNPAERIEARVRVRAQQVVEGDALGERAHILGRLNEFEPPSREETLKSLKKKDGLILAPEINMRDRQPAAHKHATDFDNWLSEQDLRAATGISRHNLVRWRQQSLIPAPKRRFLGRSAGSASYYPPVAVPMIQRLYQLRRQNRDVDEWLWRLWIDGFPINIRSWAHTRLARAQKAVARIKNSKDLQIGMTGVANRRATRTDPRRPIHRRLKGSNRHSLLMWAAAVAFGIEPAKSLYDPASPAFDALKKAGGLSNEPPPDPEINPERLSLGRLREILTRANDAELEQAREDWRSISKLAEMAEAIDWHHTRTIIDARRTSSVQPPAPIDFFLSIWHDFDVRALLLPSFIDLHRSPEHSQRFSEILAFGAWALAQCPRRVQRPEAGPDRAGELGPEPCS